MNQKGFSALVIVALVLVLISTAVGAFYLGRSSSNDKLVPQTQTPDLGISLSSPSPAAVQVTSLLGEAKKKFYKSDEKIFNSINLPQDLVSANDDSLYALQCSPTYQKDLEKGRYFYYQTPADGPAGVKEVNDEDLIFIAEKSFEVDFGADMYRACKVEDGRYILEYDKYAGGGGFGNKSIFGVLNTDKTFEKITEIPNDGSPYFECNQIMQLTKGNILWYSCGGGDGGFGSTSIYKIDLVNKNHTRVIKCDSRAFMDTSDKEPEVKCQ